jgi:hypothetical protein
MHAARLSPRRKVAARRKHASCSPAEALVEHFAWDAEPEQSTPPQQDEAPQPEPRVREPEDETLGVVSNLNSVKSKIALRELGITDDATLQRVSSSPVAVRRDIIKSAFHTASLANSPDRMREITAAKKYLIGGAVRRRQRYT